MYGEYLIVCLFVLFIGIDDCTNSICNNGQCTDKHLGVDCACDPGFEGDFCDQSKEMLKKNLHYLIICLLLFDIHLFIVIESGRQFDKE